MSASQVQITTPEEFSDPLEQKPEPPDRLFYATGILLDAEDFKAEQLYHRFDPAEWLHRTAVLVRRHG
jgi:hypothetical protein